MGSPTKILTVFGTRPEAIKLFPLLHALSNDARFNSRVCVTGQHRRMLDQVLDMAGVRPDFDLDLMQHDQTLDALTGHLLSGIGSVLDAESPDWVIVQGDTATAMAGAMAAYYRKIPVAHVEAGLRSGDNYHPWPEEVNRKIVGGIAALHFAPTRTAAAALRRENVAPESVHVTGNTVIDALYWVTAQIAENPGLASKLAQFEQRYAGKRIVGVTSHRRENFGEGMTEIANAILRLAERPDVAVIFPVHLNPNVRSVMMERLGNRENIALIEPLDYPHFARLLEISTLILSDSGGVQEEAPALGKPVLVMRETTERPEGVEAGTAKLVGTRAERIVREATRLLDDPTAYKSMARSLNPYGDGQSAARILEIIARGGMGR